MCSNRYRTATQGIGGLGTLFRGQATDITPTPLPGLLILRPTRFEDRRGYFSESYNKRQLEAAGITLEFVQDNISFSNAPLTLRGLHFQNEPCAQAKLVSIVKGAVLDVVVDLRRSSPCFGRHFAVELSAAESIQLFVPVGFAHGFLTLEPDTLFTYKASNYYSPEHDAGIRFDDDRLGIDWGVDPNTVLTSGKDRQLPPFDPKAAYFW